MASETYPLAPGREEQVRRHLEDILRSPIFATSQRAQTFLRLIVNHALHGELDSLRERMIGAEMFGRPVSYDTGSDSVVRVRASDLRKKLAQFYETAQPSPPVRIELPSGSYVPRFHFQELEAPPARQESQPSVPISAAQQAASPQPAHEPANPTQSAASTPAVLSPRTRKRSSLAAGVVMLLIVAGLGYLGWRRWSPPPTFSGIHSIVILPLENLSGEPSQDYFADGLTEELINNLGQVSALRVISLTSSMSFKGTRKTLPQIAKELSVDAAVEGGVLRDGDQMRVSIQLMDARTDRPLWSHTYLRNISDAQQWEGEVAEAIAAEISTKVPPGEQARLATSRQQPSDPQTQDLYLHGVLLRNQGDCASAMRYFEQAISRSPDYALAHSALATCYGMLGESGQLPYLEAFTHQKQEATRAIELDDSISEAHAELANTAMTLDRNWPLAQAEFQRALELNTNAATNHEKYAFYLVRTGQLREAQAEIQRAVDLDPVSESTFHSEGFVYYFSRQYDQALAVAQTVKGLNINLPDWSFLLGNIYAAKGMYPEAIQAFERAGDGTYALGHLGNAYAREGKADEARQIISRLEQHVQQNGIGNYEIALVYTGLNDRDDAFHWLDEAYRAHDVGLVYLKVDPCLDPLRSDPRFADLLRRTGFDSQAVSTSTSTQSATH